MAIGVLSTLTHGLHAERIRQPQRIDVQKVLKKSLKCQKETDACRLHARWELLLKATATETASQHTFALVARATLYGPSYRAVQRTESTECTSLHHALNMRQTKRAMPAVGQRVHQKEMNIAVSFNVSTYQYKVNKKEMQHTHIYAFACTAQPPIVSNGNKLHYFVVFGMFVCLVVVGDSGFSFSKQSVQQEY